TWVQNNENKNHNKSHVTDGFPGLKSGAQTNTTVVQHSEQRREPETNDEMGQIHRLSRHSIKLNRVECREDVTCNPSYRHGLPRTHDEISENHHPAGGEADELRKDFRGVSNLACRIRHGHH